MPAQKLRSFLDQNHVKYVVISHSPAYTAPEVAHSAHVSGKDMAKTVMVKIDGRMAMAVIPANFHVDLDRLQEAIGARSAELADEKEFRGMFPECELGAMPPFGNLYGLEVFVAEPLTKDAEIFFNAGSHTELIKMAYRDFERLVSPRIVNICYGA